MRDFGFWVLTAIFPTEKIFSALSMLPQRDNMKSIQSHFGEVPNKPLTGIAGFDEITGAWPR